MFLQLHVVFPSRFVIPRLSHVFSISPVLCLPLGLVAWSSAPPSSSLWSIPCSLQQCLRKPPQSSVFSFFFFPLSPEVYATAFLFYLISRLVLDAFSSLAPPQRSAVFSLTPVVDSESRFPISRSCTYIPSLIPSILFSFFFPSLFISSLSPRSSTMQIDLILLSSVLEWAGVSLLFSLTTSQKLAVRDFYS